MLSVRHTGTMFTLELIRDFVPHVFRHIDLDHIDFLTAAEAPIIVPMRNPHLVGQSWLGSYAAGIDTYNNEQWNLAKLRWSWDALLNIILPKKPLFLPVDTENRQQYLDKINATLGQNFKTQWKPVNAQRNRHPYTETDSKVLDFYEDIKRGVYL